MTKKLQNTVLASIFIALIIMMTIVPYTGYISYGVVEITTLHIVVILGAVLLGPSYGTLLGFTWGLTCFFRAFTNPLFAPFINPLISVLPRILVGLVAGLLFKGLSKRINDVFAAIISAIAATLTNTVLVLSALYFFGGTIKSLTGFFELFKSVINVIIGVNGVIELVSAIIIVPVLYKVLSKIKEANQIQTRG